MNLIFSTSTKEFQPVSYGDSYLYDNYAQVLSFLKNSRIDKIYLLSFSKPIISASTVDWYSELAGPMIPLSEYGVEHKESVEKSYYELIGFIKSKISELIQSGDGENRVWAELLEAVFTTENNQIVSNGSEWALIWGWKFRSGLKYVQPIYNPKSEEKIETGVNAPIVEEPKKDEPEVNDSYIEPVLEEDYPKEEEEPEVEKIQDPPPQPPKQNNTTPISIGFLERIKRFFRWISYRFWGLMLLILFALLICCICRRCCGSKIDCSQYENINRSIDSLDNVIKSKCRVPR